MVQDQMMNRLYGVPGAERLHFDPQTVYESELEPYGLDELEPGQTAEIEEWSVHPPQHHLPSAPMLLEWIDEWSYDNGELYEDFGFEGVMALEEVKLAAEILLSVIANRVGWRMADTKLASHWVSWDEEGEPLLDGERMYSQDTVKIDDIGNYISKSRTGCSGGA